MSQSGGSLDFENVVCPFCGLLCDDVQVSCANSALKMTKNGCELSREGFELPATVGGARISGRDAAPDEAIAKAAGIIGNSKTPLYGGLSTDVNGMRAVMALADKTCGVVDHAGSEILDRNIAVLQSAGWFMSTLTETRNRADVIVIAGSDIHALHPRFFERVVCASESMFGETPAKRTVIFLGEGLDKSGAVGPRIGEVVEVACPNERVGEVLSALLALLNGQRVRGEAVAGVPVSEIEALGERFREASYGVMAWAPAGLKAAQPDLTVHTISEVVKKLNETTRWAGLSLGGNEGATTAASVCGWQSGFPSRVSFASGAPNYDPHLHSIKRKLKEGEGDLLVWVASFGADFGPPQTDITTIVLGTPGLKLAKEPDVFIPVGTPGLDHAGQLIRCDNVVSLPLRSLGRNQNPSVAHVLSTIQAAL